MKTYPRICVCGLLASAVMFAGARGETRLLRFPDIHEDQLVFCHGGDLWRVAADGGLAARVTAHPGLEVFPKFSPDGKQIAFTGQYDGDEQVYLVDSLGGVPSQLTFYPARGPLPDRWGYDNQVYGWTSDGTAVLFRSMRYAWGLTDTRLFTAAVRGGLPEPLPMRVSGGGDFSPDGTRVVFSPLTRDFRTWKRYQGGWAQDLFMFDLGTSEFRQITDHARTDRDPMWIGDDIYFASDRDGTLNLFRYHVPDQSTSQVTHFHKFDVRWPSKGGDQIVYELNGTLRVLDTARGKSRRVAVTVPTDGLALRPHRVAAAGALEDFDLSPHGKRVAIAARGDVFSVPVEKGPTRNLTRSSGDHDKWVAWSPDGSRIAYLSDASGEEEIYVIDQKGNGTPRRITHDGRVMRYRPVWSHAGKHLAFSDKDGKLWVVEVSSGESQQVADNPEGQLLDYVWSPCDGYLAFTMGNPNDLNSIFIWDRQARELHRVGDGQFNDFNPAWDPQGKYLYFLSDREFAPLIDSREWNYVQDRETAIFALALRRDVPHPFPPESDEESVKPGKSAKSARSEASTPSAPSPPESPLDVVLAFFEDDGSSKKATAGTIDFEGLADRVARVPVPADNLSGLTALSGHLLFLRSGPFYYGRPSDRRPDLRVFSLKDRQERTLAESAGDYSISHHGRKVLVRGESGLQLLDVARQGDASKPKVVSLDTLSVTVDPRQEWRQIFREIWRRFRDFFYVENMHGYDWEALYQQYEPLLQHVSHRSDLNYVIGEMIAELNVGHAYNTGGDFDRPRRPDIALPGAVFELDRKAQRYRIAKIYRGDNHETHYRSPLTEVGIDVSVGDYVLQIDGEELTAEKNPYELLRFKAGNSVTFRVNEQPQNKGARDITFQPLADEADLIYLDMVLSNRAKVAEATDGQVGYIHLPDMGEAGIREFNKWFYGQIRKKGLIIDVRTNGGGNVSQMILERLGRKLLATGFPRTDDTTNTYPYTVFHGELVCLLDEDSASDGDIFPAMFRQAGLGPLIGKRSWGGVTGITNRGTLIDGGSVSVPEFGFASAEGKWIIEGEGVVPDIEVENDPKSLIEGRDPQLERGIREIERAIQQASKSLPNRPKPPVKTTRS